MKTLQELWRQFVEQAEQKPCQEAQDWVADQLAQGKTLEEMAKSAPLDWRRWMVRHANTPIEVLAALSQDEDWRIRSAVARHANTPIEALTVLSQDEDWYVRSVVAEHSSTPIEVLAVLAQDGDEDIRSHASQRISTI